MKHTILIVAAVLALGRPAGAQAPVDWTAIQAEAVATLQAYIRIDTSNPPGNVGPAVDLLAGVLTREGIPFERFESAPGRSILMARLKGTGQAKPILLLHHTDVVPADRSRWKRDPFGGEIADGAVWGRGAMDMKGIGVAHLYAFLALKRQNVPLDRDVIFMAVPDEEIGGEIADGTVWGRGAMDMKGIGVAHLYAFLALKRQNVPLDRDVIFMAVPDEEIGGQLGAVWMRENHYEKFEPEYILDEGGFGSRDLFSPDKLVFGISVAEKKILWLELTAEGVAGHGSQPHDQNPNDRLVRALARLLAEPMPTSQFEVLETMKSRVGDLAPNKFNNAIQHSTISVTSIRSGVGDPPKVNVIPSIATATLDCRVLPGTTKADWLALVARRLGDPAIRIEVTYESENPVVTTQESALYRALEAAVKQKHPDAIVTPMIVPFGTDANGFRPHGVKSYGFFPAILPAAALGSMHGDAEFIPVDALGPAIEIFFKALRATAGRLTADGKW